MPTECSPTLFEFARVQSRFVVASFDGGRITSDAGALLLGSTDRVIGLTRRLAAYFTDARNPAFVEHEVQTLVMQRVVGIALGYEDLIDHDELRHDPVMAVLAGKLTARRSDCAPLAGKSTLNRLELSRPEPTRYARLAADTGAIETLFFDLFLDAHKKAPAQITLDPDATDDPVHGHQEGRFFHGYYDCYCYLPLYVFCGRHLLAARLRRSNIDAAAGSVEEIERIVRHIRARWPRVRILLRADGGFARDTLMAWCEANRVDYLLGLARNTRLVDEIGAQMQAARADSETSGKPARRFRDFARSTLDSWSRVRRVIGKAEWTGGEGQPALRGDLAEACRGRGAPSLRGDLLRPRRNGEPHQGVSARPVRRPYFDRDHAGQSTSPVARLRRLRADMRPAPHRACPHPVRRRDLRHDPAAPAQDRRPGPHQRPTCRRRDGLGLPVAARVRAVPRHAPNSVSIQGPQL